MSTVVISVENSVDPSPRTTTTTPTSYSIITEEPIATGTEEPPTVTAPSIIQTWTVISTGVATVTATVTDAGTVETITTPAGTGPHTPTVSQTATFNADTSRSISTLDYYPLTTVFPQPTLCDDDWYLTTVDGQRSLPFLSSGRLDPSYASCQPDGKADPEAFSPGICPDHMTTAAFDLSTRDGPERWVATCCQNGFSYASGDGKCHSSVSSTSVRSLVITAPWPETGTWVALGAYYTETNIMAIHDHVIAVFEASDLSRFPSTIAYQLDLATKIYLGIEPSSTIQPSSSVTPTTDSTVGPTETPKTGGTIPGAIIGGAVTGVVVCVILLAAVIFLLRRKRRRAGHMDDTDHADYPPELDGIEKIDGRPPRELHSDSKAAELGTYRPEVAAELSADIYNNVEGIPELDAQQGYWNPAPAPPPKPESASTPAPVETPSPQATAPNYQDLAPQKQAFSPESPLSPDLSTEGANTRVVSPDVRTASPPSRQEAMTPIPDSCATSGPGSYAGVSHSVEDIELRWLEEEEARIRERKRMIVERKGGGPSE